MAENLKNKAKNYFILGVIAENLNMPSEAATNFFKALFAVDDAALLEKINNRPKDHSERFGMLKENIPELYTITDRLFGIYRRTYTQDLEKEEAKLVKKRIMEAFANAKIPAPTAEEVKAKFRELIEKKFHFQLKKN